MNLVRLTASPSIHHITSSTRVVICVSSPFLVFLPLFLCFELPLHRTIHIRINGQLLRRCRSMLRCGPNQFIRETGFKIFTDVGGSPSTRYNVSSLTFYRQVLINRHRW